MCAIMLSVRPVRVCQSNPEQSVISRVLNIQNASIPSLIVIVFKCSVIIIIRDGSQWQTQQPTNQYPSVISFCFLSF